MTLAELLKAIEAGETTTRHAEAVRYMADILDSYYRRFGYYKLANRWADGTMPFSAPPTLSDDPEWEREILNELRQIGEDVDDPAYPPTPPDEAV